MAAQEAFADCFGKPRVVNGGDDFRPPGSDDRVRERPVGDLCRSAPCVIGEPAVRPADERAEFIAIDCVDVDNGGVAELREPASDDAQHLIRACRAALRLDIGVQHEGEVVCRAAEAVEALVLLEHLRNQSRDRGQARDLRSQVARSSVAEHQQPARAGVGQERHEGEALEVGMAGECHALSGRQSRVVSHGEHDGPPGGYRLAGGRRVGDAPGRARSETGGPGALCCGDDGVIPPNAADRAEGDSAGGAEIDDRRSEKCAHVFAQ